MSTPVIGVAQSLKIWCETRFPAPVSPPPTPERRLPRTAKQPATSYKPLKALHASRLRDSLAEGQLDETLLS